MKKRMTQTLIASVTILWSASTLSAVESVSGTIRALYADANYYGNCLVWVPNTATSIDCPASYYSADCKGDFNAKDVSRLMWDSIQLSYALDNYVILVVNDEKKHNGHCVIDRVTIAK